jgi:hypothetical protein
VSRSAIALIVCLFLCPVLSFTARAESAITEQEAQSIAVDAYIYFYPLVTMDVTRKQLTNKAPGPGVFGGPMNMFANVEAFPPADSATLSAYRLRPAQQTRRLGDVRGDAPRPAQPLRKPAGALFGRGPSSALLSAGAAMRPRRSTALHAKRRSLRGHRCKARRPARCARHTAAS